MELIWLFHIQKLVSIATQPGPLLKPQAHGQQMLSQLTSQLVPLIQPLSSTAQTDQKDKPSETVSPSQSLVPTAMPMLTQLLPVPHGHTLLLKAHGQQTLSQLTSQLVPLIQPLSSTAQTDQKDKPSETVSPSQSLVPTAKLMLTQLLPVSHGHMPLLKHHGLLTLSQLTSQLEPLIQPVLSIAQTSQKDKLSETVSPSQFQELTAMPMFTQVKKVSQLHTIDRSRFSDFSLNPLFKFLNKIKLN